MDKMVSRNFRRPLSRAVVLLLGVIVGFSACKKPEDNVGLDILDPADTLGLVISDTATLNTYSLADDSVRTNNLSRNLVGSFLDADFGFVQTSTYTQIRLSTNNVGDGENPMDLELDSIVLSLTYEFGDPWYGQTDPQTFAVYELDEDLLTDTTYYAHDVINTLNDNLVFPGDEVQSPDTGLVVVVGEDTLLPQIRIRLKDELGQRFLNEWGGPNVEDNENFLAFFKGIHITTENVGQAPDQGAALHFDMLDANSKVTLYYRNTLPGEEDTIAYNLDIDEQSARFTRVELDHSQAPTQAVYQALMDTTIGQELFYVQSGQGVRGRIQFPHIMRYLDPERRALAKAELIIPVKAPANSAWEPPTTLFVFRTGDDGGDLFIPDQFELSNHVGGVYDEDEEEYRFNITRYLQQVLNGTLENDGLHFVPSNRGVSVARVELMGQENLERQAKLVLTFTRL